MTDLNLDRAADTTTSRRNQHWDQPQRTTVSRKRTTVRHHLEQLLQPLKGHQQNGRQRASEEVMRRAAPRRITTKNDLHFLKSIWIGGRRRRRCGLEKGQRI